MMRRPNATAAPAQRPAQHSPRSQRRDAVHVRALVHEVDGTTRRVEFSGRPAQALGYLIGAGDRGITSLDVPHGWRLAHYILLLRRGGLPIETVSERAGDVTFGRYRLTRPMTLVQPWHERAAS